MRGIQSRQPAMFSYVSQEDRIPGNHPLRILRTLVNPILESLSGRFTKLYAETGPPVDSTGTVAACFAVADFVHHP